MKYRNIQFALLYLFILISIAFIPEHSLTLPLSKKAVISWSGIAILLFLIYRSFANTSKEEFKSLCNDITSKIRPVNITAGKNAARLLYTGGACWFSILIFKDNLFPLVLFVAGAICLCWGLSLVLEESGLYDFSQSKISSKWFISSLSASILFWAGFSSAGQINSVFKIDPTFFPFTLSAMMVYNVAILFFILMIPVFMLASIILVVNFIYEVFGKFENKSDREILPFILVFSAYASLFGIMMLMPKAEINTVKNIASKTDFNSKHTCEAEWLKDKSVIFIGPNSQYVLAISEESPTEFEVQKCLSL